MISRDQLWMITRRSAQEFGDDHCTQMAAAISYYVLFSLFPFLILVTGVLGIALNDEELESKFVSTSTFTYDDNGNVLTATDAKSNVTTYAYNNKDKVISVTDAVGPKTPSELKTGRESIFVPHRRP